MISPEELVVHRISGWLGWSVTAWAVLVATTAVAGASGAVPESAAPVLQQEDSVSSDGIDALTALGLERASAEAVLAGGTVDGVGDTFRFAVPGSVPATITDGYVDIIDRGGLGVRAMSPGTDGTVPCGSTTDDGTWVCAGSPDPSVDHWLLWMELAGPVPEDGGDLTWSYAFPYYDMGASDLPWVAQDPFAWDTFQGTNRWPQLTRSPGVDWQLQITDTAFQALPSNAFALISGSMLILALPADESGVPFEMASASGGAAFGGTAIAIAQSSADVILENTLFALVYFAVAAHIHDGSFGQNESNRSGVDTAPDVNTPRGSDDLDQTDPTVIEIGGGEPPAPASVPPSTAAPSTAPPSPAPTSAAPATNPAPTDSGSGSFPWLPLIFVLVIAILVFVWARRTRTRGGTTGGGTRTGGGGPGGGGTKIHTGEDLHSTPPEEEPSRADFGVYFESSTGRVPVRVPAKGARHLGDYIIAVASRIDEGTVKDPAKRETKKSQSQRVYAMGFRPAGYDPVTDKTEDRWGDSWSIHTTTRDTIISGSNLNTKLLSDVADREPGRSKRSSSPDGSLSERKKGKVTTAATISIVEKTTVAIRFDPRGTVESHDYASSAQSSLHVHVTADCRMHRTGGAFDHKGNLYAPGKAVLTGLAATCATVPEIRVDGEVGVNCDGGIDYRVQQAKPLELVKGTGGSLVEFGGPEIELALGPVKLGKASIALKSGTNHLLDRHMWIEERDSDNHLRSKLELDAVITTDLLATATLLTDHENTIESVIDNSLQVDSTANHELVVVANGTVDGHPVGVTLSIGAPARTRLGTGLSRLAPRLAPNDPPAGADGFVEPLGSSAKGVKHPGFQIKTGSGSTGADQIGQPKPWRTT